MAARNENTKGARKLRALLRQRGAVAKLCRETGWKVFTIRAIQTGAPPSVIHAFELRARLGIPLEDWLPSTGGDSERDPVAEIESLTLDSDGPEVERGPCPGPADLSSYLEDALSGGGVE